METNTRSDKAQTYYAHPDYLRWLPVWKKLNDVADGGADSVKEKGTTYLPATSGQAAQWGVPLPGTPVEQLGDGAYICPTGKTLGAYAYELYKFRAIFYEYPSTALADMVGRLIFEPAVIELPAGLAPMIENATKDRQSFERLVESIYREQGKYSRCAILADFESSDTVKPPYIQLYDALRIVNWNTKTGDDGSEVLDWAILDESGYVAEGISWSYRKKLRVLALDTAGDYFTQTFDVTELESDEQFKGLDMLKPIEAKADGTGGAIYPENKGNKSKTIPLVFINATNISSTPELPILNNLANTSLAIYRGEADYRQALFMQGQATPVFKGASDDERKGFLLGAQGAVFSSNPDFDATCMEVTGNGLSEMRESQDGLHKHATEEGMKLVESGANESGEALKQRGAEQTVSLNTLAATCESALQRMIEILMEWSGETGEFLLELNREFNEGSVLPAELKTMIEAYNSGFPMTLEDLHTYAREGGLSQADWEEVQTEMLDTSRDAVSKAEAAEALLNEGLIEDEKPAPPKKDAE